MDFGIIQFSSDSNILLQAPNNQTNVTFNQIQDYSLFSSDRFLLQSLGKTFVKMFIRSSSSKLIIDRTYEKITQFLANLTELLSNLLLILYLFVTFINQFWTNQSVMNSMFKFREHMRSSQPEHYNLIKLNLSKKVDNLKKEEIQLKNEN